MEHPPNNTGSPTPVRRKYSAEFKASVVEQCSQPGNTTAAVAKHHGSNRPAKSSCRGESGYGWFETAVYVGGAQAGRQR